MKLVISFARDRRLGLALAAFFSSTLAFAAISCVSDEESTSEERVGSAASALGQGSFQEMIGFGSNPGALKMYAYTPSPEPPPGAPLVLALHACSQDATVYRNVGWEELADKHGFYVVYPEQQTANNALRCFNWAGEYGNTANLTRGQGENQSIKEMVDRMIADHGVDATRVFAIGHSGGGAMVALLMSVWPDVFAGGGIMAGIPYECTTSYFEVSSCLSPGKDFTPQQWGDRARSGFPGYAGPWPRLSVWHGTNDTLVSPKNQTELIEQWSNVHGIAATPSATTTVDGHTRHELAGGDGTVLIESYEIQNGEHGSFVDPESGCGAIGSYILDYDICAASHMADFFGILGGTGEGGAGAGGSAPTAGAPPLPSTGGAAAVETSCIAGREKPCTCESGDESFKTCAADGSGYGDCDCPEVAEELSACAASPGSASASAAWVLAGLLIAGMRRRTARLRS